jgi:hypothetical protein
LLGYVHRDEYTKGEREQTFTVRAMQALDQFT